MNKFSLIFFISSIVVIPASFIFKLDDDVDNTVVSSNVKEDAIDSDFSITGTNPDQYNSLYFQINYDNTKSSKVQGIELLEDENPDDSSNIVYSNYVDSDWSWERDPNNSNENSNNLSNYSSDTMTVIDDYETGTVSVYGYGLSRANGNYSLKVTYDTFKGNKENYVYFNYDESSLSNNSWFTPFKPNSEGEVPFEFGGYDIEQENLYLTYDGSSLNDSYIESISLIDKGVNNNESNEIKEWNARHINDTRGGITYNDDKVRLDFDKYNTLNPTHNYAMTYSYVTSYGGSDNRPLISETITGVDITSALFKPISEESYNIKYNSWDINSGLNFDLKIKELNAFDINSIILNVNNNDYEYLFQSNNNINITEIKSGYNIVIKDDYMYENVEQILSGITLNLSDTLGNNISIKYSMKETMSFISLNDSIIISAELLSYDKDSFDVEIITDINSNSIITGIETQSGYYFSSESNMNHDRNSYLIEVANHELDAKSDLSEIIIYYTSSYNVDDPNNINSQMINVKGAEFKSATDDSYEIEVEKFSKTELIISITDNSNSDSELKEIEINDNLFMLGENNLSKKSNVYTVQLGESDIELIGDTINNILLTYTTDESGGTRTFDVALDNPLNQISSNSQSNVGVIVGSLFGVLAGIFLIVFGFIYWSRNQKELENEEMQSKAYKTFTNLTKKKKSENSLSYTVNVNDGNINRNINSQVDSNLNNLNEEQKRIREAYLRKKELMAKKLELLYKQAREKSSEGINTINRQVNNLSDQYKNFREKNNVENVENLNKWE